MSVNRKHRKDNKPRDPLQIKGFWPVSMAQRGNIKEQQSEEKMKYSLPTNVFSARLLEALVNPVTSILEKVIIKHKTGKKLNSREKIIYDKYIHDNQKALNADLEEITRRGRLSDVKTLEGRIRLIMLFVVDYIKHNINDMNNIDIFKCWQKLNELDIPTHLRDEYAEQITQISNIVSKVNAVKVQFTEEKIRTAMPPLNFNPKFDTFKLDDWQRDAINCMDNGKSYIALVPTSGGKTITLNRLLSKPGIRILYVCPSQPLTMQFASNYERNTGRYIPCATRDLKSSIYRVELVDKVIKNGSLCGTPRDIIDILPHIITESDFKFDWIVVDEIHMLSDESCKEMERICCLFPTIPFIGLSATIGNVERFKEWFETISRSIKIITCNKRFFNLQNYDSNFIPIHPLSVVDIASFKDGSILRTMLYPTPSDIWNLVEKLCKYIGVLEPYTYFKTDQRITIDDTLEYFQLLLKWMVKNISTHEQLIASILKSYELTNTTEPEKNLYKVAKDLQKKNMLPAIFGHSDSDEVVELARKLYIELTNAELIAHPIKERENSIKKSETMEKQIQKQRDREGIDKMGSKQLTKFMMSGKLDKLDSVVISRNQPNADFIFTPTLQLTQSQMDLINSEMKSLFPQNAYEYHWCIQALQYGIGIISDSLPPQYRNLVQTLTANGKLAVIFGDRAVFCGLDLPVRTVIILDDPNIDSIMYQQLSGRAGRRGKEKQGNVVALVNGLRIKELLSNKIPFIEGRDTMADGYVFSSRICAQFTTLQQNYLNPAINEIAVNNFADINDNLQNGWSFASSADIDFNDIGHCLRHSLDSFRVYFILGYIRELFKGCNPTEPSSQIDCARFLANYINLKEATDCVLVPLKTAEKHNINTHLRTVNLEIPDKVCGTVFQCIQDNRIPPTLDRGTKIALRDRLYKFGESICSIQHYFYYKKEIQIARLLAKLVTRICCIHKDSKIYLEPINKYIPPDSVDSVDSVDSEDSEDSDDSDD